MSINMFALMAIAIVMAMGLVAVVGLDVLTEIQNAEAKGCNNALAVNASQGRCIR